MKMYGDAELVLEVLEQVDDLGLDRDVERRDRLVADDQLRAQGDRPGDADALALAAGELVRVAVVVLGVQPDPLHQLLDLGLDAAGPARRSCTLNGAEMIVPTVCRGFSELYGSWKIICISRRSGTISLRVEVGDVPARRTRSCRRWARAACSIVRPAVDLPQPVSPTRPRVSPGPTSRLMPSTALHVADVLLAGSPPR